MKDERRLIDVPDGLLAWLKKQSPRLRYTSPVGLYECIACNRTQFIGVFGEGSNGTYEWFVFSDGILIETSDQGYGSVAAALRDVLEREV